MDIAGKAVNLVNSRRSFSIHLKSGGEIPCKLMVGTKFGIPEKESDLISFIAISGQEDCIQIGQVADISETESA